MILSTLGFIYSPDFKQVLLITKQRPAFHKNKINGLGGKLEVGETAMECIVREVKEEADILIPAPNWQLVGRMSWTEWQVDVFASIYGHDPRKARTMHDGQIDWYPVNNLPAKIISNLNWLVPLGIDVLTSQSKPFLSVTYKS